MLPPKNDAEKLNDIIFEGIMFFGLPAAAGLAVATYLMRGRARRLVATTGEHILLAGMQYYGAFSIGFSVGMLVYGPIMESKILDRLPYSDIARDIREGRRRAYHESCIPKPFVPPPEPTKTLTKEVGKSDAITQSVIWKENVHAEQRCLKNWETNWGFLTEFDSKGNTKEKVELPEKSNMFSDAIPNTNSANYGNRLGTETGKAMQSLEFKFFSESRRKKLPEEMICY
ncbi:hypothetical protein Btru_071724 [Bulinus truncatus]|nr:hypothetical protein Btru_071724 [Bulinus truncatus]